MARCRKCPVAAGSFAGPRSPGLQPEAAPWPPRSRAAVNRVWSRCVSRQGVCFLLRRKTRKDEDLHPDIKTFCPMVLTSVTPLEPPAEAFFGSPLGRALDSTAGLRRLLLLAHFLSEPATQAQTQVCRGCPSPAGVERHLHTPQLYTELKVPASPGK